MATAVRNPAPVVKTPPPTITLTLSEHEAAVLNSLVGYNVLGRDDGPRGVTAAIYEALTAAGVPCTRSFEGTVRGISA